MSNTASDSREQLFETIDQEASDADEQKNSKELYDALSARRDELSGSSKLPESDRALTDSIRDAATRRSQELAGAGSAHVSARIGGMDDNHPVPAWVWLAWGVAIAAAAAALYFLW